MACRSALAKVPRTSIGQLQNKICFRQSDKTLEFDLEVGVAIAVDVAFDERVIVKFAGIIEFREMQLTDRVMER